MMKRQHILLLTAWCLGALSLVPFTVGGTAYPAPRFTGDTRTMGHGVQRTMDLLATSTPRRRHTVRVLFYGQSITEQDWWKQVADDLRQRFPHANLVIENRAIGGHASQLLVKTVETVVTLAQGLGPGVHRLELRGPSAANLLALRVYCPPGLARR